MLYTGITTIKPSGILTPLRTHAFVQTRTMTNPKEEKKKNLQLFTSKNKPI